MSDDDLFDNGIDGEPFDHPADDDHDYYEREDFDVCNANGLEVNGWPTYGNYTITTDTFHMYWWPSNNTIDIYDKREVTDEFSNIHKHVLTIKDKNLSFFGEEKLPDEDGKVDIDFYTGEQINQKIQRYLNLKAFL